MNRQGKVWGETTTFFKNGIISSHYLEIKAGGYCSEHRHAHKANYFFVISGDLEIHIWREKGVIDKIALGPGQGTMIPPGVYHKFEALTNCQCIEIYEVSLQEPDIDRRTGGGFRR